MTTPGGPPAARTAPLPPRLGDLPVAVRSAELLRGSAARCGPGIRLASWPEGPSVRAAAISQAFTRGRVAVLLTAAWIHGATRDPRWPLEFTLLSGRAHDLGAAYGVALHQFRLADDEVLAVGGLPVASPLRTAYDLLRAERFGRIERLACRVIVAHLIDGRDAVREMLDIAGRRPYDRRVLQRLADI